MKGIILTAGAATRLKPITDAYGKVLTPIYDKPMIFYGVSLLVSLGIKEIALVCNARDASLFRKMFKHLDPHIKLSYFYQFRPLGTAHALKLAKKFFDGEDFVLLFGDNIFISENPQNLAKIIEKAIKNNTGISMFAKNVEDPRSFGVLEYDKKFNITNMEEKPEHPKTHAAVVGLYAFKPDVSQKLNDLKISPRGEYELTDIIKEYIAEKRAKVTILPDDCQWLDTGTFDSLLACSQIVKDYEQKHGLIGCPELELYKQKIINKSTLSTLADHYAKDYKQRLLDSIPKK